MPDAASLKRLSQGRCKKVKWFSWGCRQSRQHNWRCYYSCQIPNADVILMPPPIPPLLNQMSSWCPHPSYADIILMPPLNLHLLNQNTDWSEKPSNRCTMSLQGNLAGMPSLAGLLLHASPWEDNNVTIKGETSPKLVLTRLSPSWWSFKNKSNQKSLLIWKSSIYSNTTVWGILFVFFKRFPLGFFYLNTIPILSQ